MYKDCQVTQIMATTNDKVIGNNNTIPWRCRADMKHFAANTKGKVCIMGRATFDSINPPLKGRYVIVVTSNPVTAHRVGLNDLHLAAPTVEQALELAYGIALDKEIMVVGGRQIYQQTMEVTDKLLLSTIDIDFGEADTKFDWEIPDHVEIVPFTFEADA